MNINRLDFEQVAVSSNACAVQSLMHANSCNVTETRLRISFLQLYPTPDFTSAADKTVRDRGLFPRCCQTLRHIWRCWMRERTPPEVTTYGWCEMTKDHIVILAMMLNLINKHYYYYKINSIEIA